MRKLLRDAINETSQACEYIAQGEQNMALGTILTTDALLEQTMSLYKAVVALHRLPTVGAKFPAP
jgi:hypothetical protein